MSEALANRIKADIESGAASEDAAFKRLPIEAMAKRLADVALGLAAKATPADVVPGRDGLTNIERAYRVIGYHAVLSMLAPTIVESFAVGVEEGRRRLTLMEGMADA